MNRTITSLLSASALAGTVALTTAATASAEPDWDELAACESGGNWQSTAGHYEGGIQFDPHTWDAYGGGQYAPSADQASREQQIAIGRKVLAAQGYGAWPGCSAKTGWESGGASGSYTAGSTHRSTVRHHGSTHAERQSVQQAPRRAVAQQAITMPGQAAPTLGVTPKVPTGGRVITVAPGDTLTKLAGIYRVGHWQEIMRLNGEIIEHPDWIFPGERLAIPAPQHGGHTTAR